MTSKRILEHELVPQHEILKKAEAKKLLDTLGVNATQLPKIKVDDPVVTAIKAKKGDVLRITRRSQTAGESVYYRAVIN